MSKKTKKDVAEADDATHTPAFVVPQLRVPEPFMALDDDLSTEWRLWKQRWDAFEIATGLDQQGDRYRVATFVACLGPRGLEVYNSLPFGTEEERNTMDTVANLMTDHCQGEQNEIFQRYVFAKRVQQPGESIENFVAALRLAARSCK
eukprot:m.296564 g.296564  ORF g.296564 m.296564 type:complete len:148 (+) comp40764_c1_seq12:3054-3497(+)